MPSELTEREQRRAVWQLSHIQWALDEDLIRPETAERYRGMVAGGEVRELFLSWIKLDGDPEKVAAWVKQDNTNRREVLVGMAQDIIRDPKHCRAGDAEMRRIVRRVRTGAHLLGGSLSAPLAANVSYGYRRQGRAPRSRRRVVRSARSSPGRSDPDESDPPLGRDTEKATA